MSLRRHLVAAIICAVFVFGCLARSSKAQTCPGPPSDQGTAKGNIFTEQQEMDLGDAIAEQFERNFRIIQDDQLNSYLNKIAQGLLAELPATKMKFRIVLVDLPVTNAFTMPGGRIYITRKLVSFARSDDELAGVLGHELGHAITHQPAASFSLILRQELGVKQVGDRADIFLKYNQLIENIARKHLTFNPMRDEGDMVADSYGLYAMSRAGYSPGAMADFWDRLVQTQGKTGNWLTDLFGTTTPNERRLRAMRKYATVLPASCIGARTPSNPKDFSDWQQAVIAYTTEAGAQSLPGLIWKRSLAPPLESEISNVKFSPDGNYILAQDDFSVYVLSREPLKPLFRIRADDVEPASFTPDSKSVLIWSHALHVEKWNIGTQKRTDVHELATLRPCMEDDVSPDGAVIACVQTESGSDLNFDLSFFDIATGKLIITKKNFYGLGLSDFMDLFVSLVSHRDKPFFHMGFSQDGRYFALARNRTALAWDLSNRSSVKLSSDVSRIMSGGFVFAPEGRLIGVDAYDPKRSGSAQFPSGAADSKMLFYGQLAAPAKGEGVLVRPAGNAAVALVDFKDGKIPLTSQLNALDVYAGVYSRPLTDGNIALFDLGTRKQIASTPMPGHWIGQPQAAAVSPDMKWFAASGKTRGAIWNLTTGERLFHVYGFSGCTFSPAGNAYVLVNPHLKEKRLIAALNPLTRISDQGGQIDDKLRVAQIGPYLLNFNHEKSKKGSFDLQVYNIADSALQWTRNFADTSLDVYGSPLSGDLALVVPLDSEEARLQEKGNPELRSESKAISSKPSGRLVEVVSAPDGKLVGEFAIDTGQGSFSVREALPAGKWVVVADNNNRALVYSLDGRLTGRFFGANPSVSSEALALTAQSGTLEVYDLATLAKRGELVFGTPLAFYQFVDNGSRLFAVTEDQTAYLLDISQAKHD